MSNESLMNADETLHYMRSFVSYWVTQRDIAKAVGVSNSNINMILRGTNPPSPVVLAYFGLERVGDRFSRVYRIVQTLKVGNGHVSSIQGNSGTGCTNRTTAEEA